LRSQVLHAIDSADAVYDSDEFWKLVIARPWLDGPNGKVLAGAEVAGILRSATPSSARRYDIRRLGWDKFTIGLIPGSVVASTKACGAISLDRAHIRRFEYLVNTVAHENTHSLGLGTGARRCDNAPSDDGSLFTDGSHPPELEVWLVSYAIGDMAQCFYSSAGDAGASFQQCLSTNLNGGTPLRQGKPVPRAVVECCDPALGAGQSQRKQLREASPWCASLVCPM